MKKITSIVLSVSMAAGALGMNSAVHSSTVSSLIVTSGYSFKA